MTEDTAGTVSISATTEELEGVAIDDKEEVSMSWRDGLHHSDETTQEEGLSVDTGDMGTVDMETGVETDLAAVTRGTEVTYIAGSGDARAVEMVETADTIDMVGKADTVETVDTIDIVERAENVEVEKAQTVDRVETGNIIDTVQKANTVDMKEKADAIDMVDTATIDTMAMKETTPPVDVDTVEAASWVSVEKEEETITCNIPELEVSLAEVDDLLMDSDQDAGDDEAVVTVCEFLEPWEEVEDLHMDEVESSTLLSEEQIVMETVQETLESSVGEDREVSAVLRDGEVSAVKKGRDDPEVEEEETYCSG